MESCCKLGKELDFKKNILCETDNFFVVPTIGSIGIEGYLLLCSKEHFTCIGNIPREYDSELEETLEKTRKTIFAVYNTESLLIEHGPRISCYKGGGCIEHAHFHLVPISIDITDFLRQKFKVESIESFDRLREIYEKAQSSYLFVETQEKKRYIIEVDFPLPSQYLRQVIAKKLEKSEWDWRIYPDYGTFEKTLKNMQGKFDQNFLNICLFCDKNNPRKHRIILENNLFYSRFDPFAISPGHAEVVPARHIPFLHQLSKEEKAQVIDFIYDSIYKIEVTDLKEIYETFLKNPVNKKSEEFCKKMLELPYLDKKPDGYNIGINEGKAAGRTIDHLHIHIIPRYEGDVENPRGGIRNIIPGMGDYKK